MEAAIGIRLALVALVVLLIVSAYKTITSTRREDALVTIVWTGSAAAGALATIFALYLKSETSALPDRPVERLPVTQADIEEAMKAANSPQTRAQIRGSALTTLTRFKAQTLVRVPFMSARVEAPTQTDMLPYLVGITVFFIALGAGGLSADLGLPYAWFFAPAILLIVWNARKIRKRVEFAQENPLPATRREATRLIQATGRPAISGDSSAPIGPVRSPQPTAASRSRHN